MINKSDYQDKQKNGKVFLGTNYIPSPPSEYLFLPLQITTLSYPGITTYKGVESKKNHILHSYLPQNISVGQTQNPFFEKAEISVSPSPYNGGSHCHCFLPPSSNKNNFCLINS